MTPRVAVVTPVHGRHRHLTGQRWGLARQTHAPDAHVVVAMGDPDVTGVLAEAPDGPPAHVVDVDLVDGRLPLAAARNAGVREAAHRGAEVVVLLDVDCVPAPDLVADYLAALASAAAEGDPPVFACGVVRYLDAATTAAGPVWVDDSALEAGSTPHAARPAPPAGAVERGGDARLFWSLSFAATVTDFERVGGFDEGYVGYGAEDTDVGQRLEAAGGSILWLGGATAYHQHHGDGGLPVQHVHDIVANGGRFARRWGWWPMGGWLDGFEDLGLVRRDGAGGWVATGPARRTAGSR
ncbi:glycosyltransferase family 2 protein [Phycicoccus flavus]|uniref:glycosyltransferase family 2 protein n=1 Tax=Phycicoccus flavus TaxID=2502783 RepID=UPI000FEC1956|nr:galactosyltransferase-related protein [Phycicoccus flavus]NHA66441.1 glycosyltransferase [Phycicoccus flavus]